MSRQFEDYLVQSSISWQRYVPHTPQQNVVAKQKNKTMVEMARCLLQAKDLSTRFLAKAVYYENYLVNQILTKVVDQVTPIENWSGKKPSLHYLRTFGFFSWLHILEECSKKLDDKSHVWIMMGSFEESISYGLFDPIKQYIIIQHNVIFDEKTYGFDVLKSPSSPSYNDPFGIIKYIRSIVPPISTLTSSLTSIPESTHLIIIHKDLMFH